MFQTVLDEEAEFIDGILTKISELKIIKVEVERKRKELETHVRPQFCNRKQVSLN